MTHIMDEATRQIFLLRSSLTAAAVAAGVLHEVIVGLEAIEIYNEQIVDLLALTSSSSSSPSSSYFLFPSSAKKKSIDQRRLEVRQGPEGMYVEGAHCARVRSVEEALRLSRESTAKRSVGSHALNSNSSRSHIIITLTFTTHTTISGGVNGEEKVEAHKSKLNLIDLAGSERVDRSRVVGVGLEEAKHINKSLSALSDVIHYLGRGRGNPSHHVPFRNSKLTLLLQDSLTKPAKVLMIVTASPLTTHLQETLSSMNFAKRCRAVALGRPQQSPYTSTPAASARFLQRDAEGPRGNDDDDDADDDDNKDDTPPVISAIPAPSTSDTPGPLPPGSMPANVKRTATKLIFEKQT